MNAKLAASIAAYADEYRERFLVGNYDPDLLLINWWAALDFFLAHACFQGRRDDVSERVYGAVKEVLSPEFSTESRDERYRQLCQHEWKAVVDPLGERIGRGKVGKARDIAMVKATLSFIGQIPDSNLVKYSVEQLNLGRIGQHYAELQPALSGQGITQVGPKIAAFYLRDVVSLYQLEKKVTAEFAFCLQPVDVWVDKLARRTGVVGSDAGYREVQEAIIALCIQHGVSPLKFNQGAWYVGYHACDILLGLLAAEQGSAAPVGEEA